MKSSNSELLFLIKKKSTKGTIINGLGSITSWGGAKIQESC